MSTNGILPLVSHTTVMDPLTITIPATFRARDLIRRYLVEAWSIDNAIGRVTVDLNDDGLTIDFDDPADLSLFVLGSPLHT